MSILSAIIIGAICGWIAGKIMNVKGGLLFNIILGIVGGAFGGFIFGLLGIHFSGVIGGIICGAVGSCLLIWIVKMIRK